MPTRGLARTPSGADQCAHGWARTNQVAHGRCPGMFVLMDLPEHTRFRRLLTGQFTARRMKQLEPRITQIVEEHLDAMLHAGPPADLVQSFALLIPLLVICELLGAPHADRVRCQRDSATTFSYNATQEEASVAMQSIVGFMAELVARARRSHHQWADRHR